MQRRTLLTASASAALAACGVELAAAQPHGLRLPWGYAETGFDPAQVSDNLSLTLCGHIFEAPYTYDYLARPAVLVPCTAAALPEVSGDFRHWVITLTPGIYFSDHPAFGGVRRELTAADYVYSIKRYYDPKVTSERLYRFENAKPLGLSELRRAAIAQRTGLDYDVVVPGLRTIDRYRFEFRLADPAPRFVHELAAVGTAGAVAREVVEAHAGDAMAHPVGTGAFRLAQWRRASFIALERNPGYREHRFATQWAPEGETRAAPGSMQPVGGASAPIEASTNLTQTLARELQGQRLPRLQRVEIQIIEEAQPRWLAFQSGHFDALELPQNFAPVATPGGRVAPYLAQRGVRAQRSVTASVQHTFFNHEDPVVGGLAPEKVALRRAIALAYDNARAIRLVWAGQAIAAQSMIPPHNTGFDASFRSDLGVCDPARAAALLDSFGYLDRNRDGFREQPNGQPLVLRLASTGDQRSRQLNEIWSQSLRNVGLRIEFEIAPFGELIKRSLAGRLPMWGFSWRNGPDGDFFLGLAYGPNAGQSNDARFRLPAFDRLYERQRDLPDGPERWAVMRGAKRLMLAYMPYIAHHHAITTDLLQAGVSGFLRHPFSDQSWLHADVQNPA